MAAKQAITQSFGTAGQIFMRLIDKGVYFILPQERGISRFHGGFMLAARGYEGICAGQAEHENILANIHHFTCLVWAWSSHCVN